MLVQTIGGFRDVLQIKDDTNVFDTLGDASCLESIWTSQPLYWMLQLTMLGFALRMLVLRFDVVKSCTL